MTIVDLNVFKTASQTAVKPSFHIIANDRRIAGIIARSHKIVSIKSLTIDGSIFIDPAIVNDHMETNGLNVH